uniref:Innexin n=1 Tax=Heterorhabditis bacteriophora TaxID=37862 RepID=A0A1I7X7U0_HETBA
MLLFRISHQLDNLASAKRVEKDVRAKATNRLVIAHMSKSELRLWDWIYIGPFALMLNQYYNYIFEELTLLWIVTCTIFANSNHLLQPSQSEVLPAIKADVWSENIRCITMTRPHSRLERVSFGRRLPAFVTRNREFEGISTALESI